MSLFRAVVHASLEVQLSDAAQPSQFIVRQPTVGAEWLIPPWDLSQEAKKNFGGKC